MPGLLPHEGMSRFLNLKYDHLNGRTPRIRLFTNDVFLAPGLTEGDFDEADFDGYGQLPCDDWPAPTQDGDRWIMRHPLRVWTPTGTTTPNTIRGWYIFDTDLEELLMVYKFDAPFTVGATLTPFAVEPSLSEQNA